MKDKTNNHLTEAEIETPSSAGKFKNAEELLKAYNALEAEFTRRSQRLAELERRSKDTADNAGAEGQIVKSEVAFANAKANDETATNAQAIATNSQSIKSQLDGEVEVCECKAVGNSDNVAVQSIATDGDNEQNEENKFCESNSKSEVDGQSDADSKSIGIDSLEEHTVEERVSAVISEDEWRAEVDKFFSENPKAQPFAKEIAQEMLADESLKQGVGGLEIAFSRFLVKSYKSPSELSVSDEFLSKFVFSNEAIKSRIIQEYVTGLCRQKPPATIKSSGTTTLTPPARPKTLQEAGWIFVRDNK